MRLMLDVCERLLLWTHVVLWAVAAVVLVLPAIAAAQGVAAMPDSPLKDKLNRERPMCFRQQVITDWLVYPDGRKRKIASIVMTVPCERQ